MKILPLGNTLGLQQTNPHLLERIEKSQADVLIFAGNWSPGFGSWKDTTHFVEWLSKSSIKHKIVVPGPHDYGVESDFVLSRILFERNGIHLLIGSPIEIDGIWFDGGPWSAPSDSPFKAFVKPEGERRKLWERLHPRTNVLVTWTSALPSKPLPNMKLHICGQRTSALNVGKVPASVVFQNPWKLDPFSVYESSKLPSHATGSINQGIFNRIRKISLREGKCVLD